MLKKITIYGLGAIGGWLAAHLASAGAEVSAVARGATLQALQARGLRLRAGGSERTCAIRASADPAELGPQDVVIVAVKAPAMAAVAAHIGPLLGPDTAVLTAMNGVPWWFLQGFGGPAQGRTLESVDPDGAIARAIAPERVIGAVVHASCSVAAPAVIQNNMGSRIIVGEPNGAASARVQALHALLRAGGLASELTPQIQREIWFKLWGNMTVNPMSALTGATADKLLDDPLTRAFMSRVMREARTIGARIGIPIGDSPEDRHAVTRKLGALKPSMLQDVEAHKPLEIDALVTAVRELGQITGVPTPDTDALLGLARVHARVLGLYPRAPTS